MCLKIDDFVYIFFVYLFRSRWKMNLTIWKMFRWIKCLSGSVQNQSPAFRGVKLIVSCFCCDWYWIQYHRLMTNIVHCHDDGRDNWCLVNDKWHWRWHRTTFEWFDQPSDSTQPHSYANHHECVARYLIKRICVAGQKVIDRFFVQCLVLGQQSDTFDHRQKVNVSIVRFSYIDRILFKSNFAFQSILVFVSFLEIFLFVSFQFFLSFTLFWFVFRLRFCSFQSRFVSYYSDSKCVGSCRYLWCSPLFDLLSFHFSIQFLVLVCFVQYFFSV